jgi:hypothetical protein
MRKLSKLKSGVKTVDHEDDKESLNRQHVFVSLAVC